MDVTRTKMHFDDCCTKPKMDTWSSIFDSCESRNNSPGFDREELFVQFPRYLPHTNHLFYKVLWSSVLCTIWSSSFLAQFPKYLWIFYDRPNNPIVKFLLSTGTFYIVSPNAILKCNSCCRSNWVLSLLGIKLVGIFYTKLYRSPIVTGCPINPTTVTLFPPPPSHGKNQIIATASSQILNRTL